MRKTLLSFLTMALLSIASLDAAIQYSLNPVTFEDGVLPAAWTQDAVAGDQGEVLWAVEGGAGVELANPAGAHGGQYRLAARGTSGTVENFVTKLISPAMNLASSSVFQPVLQFSHAQVARSNYMDTLTVYYRVSATAEWVQLAKYSSPVSAWKTEQILLPSYLGSTAYQVAFEIKDHAGLGVVLDDISVYNTSRCADAVIDAVSNITAHSATVSYHSDGTYSAYEVVVTDSLIADMSLFDMSKAIYHGSDEYEVTLTGLQSYHTYYVYVRTDCNDNESGYTNWVSTSFLTAMLADLPYAQNFNLSATTGYKIPDGWTAGTNVDTKNLLPYVACGMSAIYKNTFSVDSTLFLSFCQSQTTIGLGDTIAGGKYVYAATPQLDGTLNQYEVSFWATAGDKFTNGGVEKNAAEITVGVMTDAKDWSSFVAIKTVKIDHIYQHKHIVVSLAGYQGAGQYVAIASAAAKPNRFAIDNFEVRAVSATPEDVKVSHVLPTGFDVTASGAFSVNVYAEKDYVKGGVLPAVASVATAVANSGVAHVALADSLQGKTLIVYAVNNDAVAFPVTVRIPTVIAATPDTIKFETAALDLKTLGHEIHYALTTKASAEVFFPFTTNSNLYPALETSTPKYDGNHILLNGIDNYFVLPYVEDLTGLEVLFRLSAGTATYAGQSKVAVGIMTDPYDLSTFVELGQFEGGNGSDKNAYAKCEQEFAAYTGAGHYIAIRAIAPATKNTTYGSRNLIDQVIVQAVPTCREATGVVSVPGGNDVAISWEANGMSKWQVKLYENAAKTTLKADTVIEQTSVSLDGLAGNTTYYFTIATICGTDTILSDVDYSFTTKLGLPYQEDFETVSVAFNKWTLPTGVTRASSYAHGGSYALQFATTSTVVVVLPEIAGIESLSEFSFWWRCEGTSNSTMGYLEAGYVTDATDTATFVSLLDLNVHKYAYEQQSVTFNAIPAGSRAAFRYSRATSSVWYLYVDDVKLRSLDANCQGLKSLVATPSTNSVSLAWSAGGTQSLSYEVATDAAFANKVAEGETTDNPLVISGLSANTLYYVRAHQTCDAAKEFEISTSFRTECAAVTPAQLGTIDFAGGADDLNCWKVGINDTTGMSVSNYNTYIPQVKNVTSFGKVLYLNRPAHTTSTKYGNNYFAIMPELDIDSIQKYQVAFSAATNSSSATNYARLYVGVTTDPNSLDTYETVDTLFVQYAADSTKMKTYVIGFDNYQGDYEGNQGKYITFYMDAPVDSLDNVLIDNIYVEAVDGCHQIVDMEAKQITSSSAKLDWSSNASAFQFALSSKACRPDTVAQADFLHFAEVSESEAEVTGLEANTTYYAYVRAICAAGDTSKWSGHTIFTTSLGVPYVQTFNMTTGTFVGDWQRYSGVDPDDLFSGKASFENATVATTGWAYSSSYDKLALDSARVKHVGCELYSTYSKYWMVSPVIDLTTDLTGKYLQLSYDAALTYWSSGAVPTNTASQTFYVLISTDGGKTWKKEDAIIYSDADATATYTLKSIPNGDGANYAFNISKYAGKSLQIAMGSKVTANDNRIHIANVKVEAKDITCEPVVNIVAKSDRHAATLSFNVKFESDTVEYAVLPADSTFHGIALGKTDSLKASVAGLEASTQYNVYARSLCASGDTSAWFGPVAFTTLYEISAPYAVNFDNVDELYPIYSGDYYLQNGWSAIYSSYTYTPYVKPNTSGSYGNTYSRSGDNALYAYCYTGASCYGYTVMPYLDADLDTLQLSFWARAGYVYSGSMSSASNTYDHHILVGTMTDPSDTATFVLLQDVVLDAIPGTSVSPSSDPEGTNYWRKQVVSLEGAQGKYIAFVQKNETKTNYLCIDDIAIEKMGCPLATKPTFTAITPNSAVAHWTKSTATAAVDVTLNGTAIQSIVTAEDSLVLTDLVSATIYSVQVRSICENDTAEAVSASFKTAYGLPFLEDFDASGSSTPEDWTNPSSTSVYFTTSSGGGFTTPHMYMGAYNYYSSYSGNTTVYNKQIFLPEMELDADAANVIELSFDMSLTSSSSGTTAPSATYLTGHTFMVGVSVNGGNNFVPVLLLNDTNAVVADKFGSIPATAAKYTVDLTAFSGQKALIGFGHYVDSTTTTTSSCYTYINIDNVKIREVSLSCNDPKNLVADSIESNRAFFAWSGDNTASYKLQIAKDNKFATLVVDTVVAADTCAWIPGLNSATQYYARVATVCGDNLSDYATASFTSACEVISALPWVEDFNSLTAGIPVCWDNSEGTTTTATNKWSYNANGHDAACVRFNSFSNSNGLTNVLVTPEIALPSEVCELVFYIKNPTGGNCVLKVAEVGSTTRTTLLPSLRAITAWTEYVVDLSAYANKHVQFYFDATSNYGNGDAYVYLDDVQVRKQPTCRPIISAKVASIEAHSASVIVVPADSNYLSFQYAVGVSGAKMDTLAVVDATKDTIAISGLKPATTYDFYARTICTVGDTAAWFGPLTFTTNCEAVSVLPWSENFEKILVGSETSSAPLCWGLLNANEGAYPYVYVNNNSTYVHGGSKSLFFKGAASKYAYAIMPDFADLSNAEMTFWYKDESTTLSGKLFVGYMTDITDANSFVNIVEVERTTTFTQVLVSLTSVPAGARVAFKYGGASDNYYLGIDDIYIREIPQDETLSDVLVSNVGRTSFDVNWVKKGQHVCNEYKLVVSKTALNAAALDTVPGVIVTDTTFYHATNLDRESDYYVYVRTNCAIGAGYGKWVSAKAKTIGLTADYQIGDDTQTAYLVFTSYGNSCSQMIYTAEELHAAGLSAGNIVSAAFYYNATSSSYDKSQKLYIGHTTKSEYAGSNVADFVPASDLTAVYGPVEREYESGWVTYTFSTPFNWDGVSNIVLAMETSQPDGESHTSSNGWGTYGTSTSPAYRLVERHMDRTPVTMDDLSVTSSGSRYATRANVVFAQNLPACAAVDTVQVSNITASTATISWSASAADYLGSYEVVYADSLITSWSGVVPQFSDIDTLSVELTGLEQYTTYYVYVRAVCNANGHNDGTSGWQRISFQTKADCNEVEGLKATLTAKTEAKVTWNSTVQASNFCYILSTVKYDLDSVLLDTVAKTGSAIADTVITLSGLNYDTQYYVYVANECGVGSYAPFMVDSFHTAASCPAVANLHFESAAFNAVQLAWNRGQFGEENEWEVGIMGNASSVMNVTDSAATIIGLSENTHYTFYVKAVCGVSEFSATDTIGFTTPAMPSDDVVIGGGTASASLVNSVWGNTCSQMIYTAEELIAAGFGPGEIISAAFYYSGASSTYTKSQTLYVGHTTLSEFAGYAVTDFVPVSDLTAVNGPEDRQYTSGWVTYDFAAPFSWDGVSNLVFAMETSQPAGASHSTSSGWTTYGTSTDPAYRLVERHKDSTPVTMDDLSVATAGSRSTTRPNITLTMAPASCRKAVNVVASAITTNSAKLSWMPGGSETSWKVLLSDSVLTDAQLAAAHADTMDHVMSKTYTGLTDDTDYYFYIRSLCSATDNSDWKSITFRTIASCLIPKGLKVDSISDHAISLSWKEQGAESYEVAYGMSDSFNLNDTATYAVVNNLTDTTLSIAGLKVMTAYSFAVRAICSADDNSRWSAPVLATTDCGVLEEFPYVENFNRLSATQVIPNCWDNSEGTTTDGDYKWSYSASGHEGACVRFDSYSNPSRNTNILKTPEIAVPQEGILAFSFWCKNPTGGAFKVYAVEEGQTAQVVLFDNLTGISSWEQKSIKLTQFAGKNIRIYFHATSNYGTGDAYMYVDDVMFELQDASCAGIESVSVSDVTTDGFTLNWTALGSQEVSVKVLDAEDNLVYSNDTTTAQSAVITGLAGYTTYHAEIVQLCGNDTARVSVKTALSVPFHESFEDITSGVPEGWDNTLGSTNTTSYRWSSYETGYQGRGVRFNSYNNGNRNDNYLALPSVMLPVSDEVAQLSFYYKNPKGGDFEVLISADGGQTKTVLLTKGQVADWTKYEVNLNAYRGQSVIIYFHATSNYGTGDAYLYLDEIDVRLLHLIEYDASTCGNTGYGDEYFSLEASELKTGLTEYIKEVSGGESGVDTLVTMNLTVWPAVTVDIYDTICYGETYRGKVYTQDAVIPDFSLQTVHGCDSLLQFHLHVLPELASDTTFYVCRTEGYEWEGQRYYVDGNYTQTLTSSSAFGCDSVVTTHFRVSRSDSETTNKTVALCMDDSYTDELFGTISEAGHYSQTTLSKYGCDSIVNLNVLVADMSGNLYDTITVDQLPYEYDGEQLLGVNTPVGTYDFSIALSCATTGHIYITVKDNQEGIFNTFDGQPARKMVVDNRIYIVIGDKWFDAAGVQTQKPE